MKLTCTLLGWTWLHLCSGRISPVEENQTHARSTSAPHGFKTLSACVGRHLRAADLEELHPDTGEHELKQRGDDHDVSDGSDCDKNALHHVL